MSTQLTDQPTAAPTNKVAAAGIAGVVTVLVVYLLGAFFNIQLPDEVSAALTVLVTFVAAYFKRNEVQQ